MGNVAHWEMWQLVGEVVSTMGANETRKSFVSPPLLSLYKCFSQVCPSPLSDEV